MKIHEYQAKEILRRHGVRVPKGEVATTPEEAERIARDLGGKVAVKAQVLAGGRGKGGGIKLASTAMEARSAAQCILGMNLQTAQTGGTGVKVRKILVEEAVDIARELYLGMVVDRSQSRPVVMASTEGGMEIEEVAAKSPEKILKEWADPVLGLRPYQARALAFRLKVRPECRRSLVKFILGLSEVFHTNDCSLAEINPLVITSGGDAIALDAKINIDDSALAFHPKFESLRDLQEENPFEMKAREGGLSYVKLEGNIGCVVNGAGLAMATMDLVKHYGGEPANFLDIGGSSNPEKVMRAMEIILADPNVKAILFNIFGGITRCDDVANGLVQALEAMEVEVPVVVRLTGTNEEAAHRILSDVGLKVGTSMDEAVRKAVQLGSDSRSSSTTEET
jgi:succinyl-CoA synthetase beta subunit